MKNKSANNKLPLLLITEKRKKITVTPQLVDHAHIDSCAAIGCNLVQHTHPFNGPLSGTTRVGPYQKRKNYLDFTEARDSEWQWHQLGHMQVCTLLQTVRQITTSAPHRSVFYRPDAFPAAQPTVSKHIAEKWTRLFLVAVTTQMHHSRESQLRAWIRTMLHDVARSS